MPTSDSPLDLKNLTLEQFRQFRSKVEPLSEEKIRDEIHKKNEENERIQKELSKKGGGGSWPPPGLARS